MTEPGLLYFSPVHWQSYAQRPHHFAWRFPGRVLWVDPYVSRLPRWSDLGYSPGLMDQRTPASPQVVVVRPFALPVEPIPGGPLLNRLFQGPVRKAVKAFAAGRELTIGVGKPCRLAADALRIFDSKHSFYDAMDHFPAFHSGLSRRSAARCEHEILQRVKEVFASSRFLAEKLAERHGRVKKVLNACEVSAEITPRPPLSFGYVGTMASWFDWDLVIELAGAYPQAPIHLVGPVFGKPPPLPGNIVLHDPCPPEEAARHIVRVSIGLIPFKRTLLTQGVDPIKYYEYRALGRPVLTTRFGEMELRGEADGVFFLEKPFRPIVERAQVWTDDRVDRFREENSWEQRLKEAGVFASVGG